MRLADYLSDKGLSLADFAREIGVTTSAVSRYVAGLRFPDRNILIRIRRITKGAVTPNDFLPDREKRGAA